jgi:phosphate transport system substrate-binding protein
MPIMRCRTAGTFLGALGLVSLLIAPGARAAGTEFTINGSTQMFTLGALMANRYQNINQEVNINTIPSTGQFGFDGACQTSFAVGMTDIYIQDSQLRETGCGDMVAIPVAVSATPVVYNLPGTYFRALNPKAFYDPAAKTYSSDGFTLLHPVHFSPQVLADIYMGKVKMWNDREITALNPGMSLPGQRIHAYVSSEPGSSGFVFNQWLCLSVPAWNKAVGVSITPSWPTGYSVSTPSSGQMVQSIKNTPYSLGFVGFDYAISNKLQAAALKNASGVFLTPSLTGISKAIGYQLSLGMPGDFRRSFVTVPGKDAFNPADFEFYVTHQKLTGHFEPPVRQAVKAFLEWAVSPTGGQQFIKDIELQKIAGGTKTELAHGFVPVPPEIQQASKLVVDGLQV